MGGSKHGTAALTATFPSLPGMTGRAVPTASAGKPPSAPSAQVLAVPLYCEWSGELLLHTQSLSRALESLPSPSGG